MSQESATDKPVRAKIQHGERRGLYRLLGPAFVAAIAYVDPGNVAANVSAGAGYDYLLVWVLVLANLMAVVVQYLSAKLGIVTGRSLPELLGERMSTPARYAFLAQAEIVAAATDLAEVIGGAIALNILFNLPMLIGGLVIGAVSMAILAVQTRGQRRFEGLVMALLVVITFGFVAGLFVSPLDWGQAVRGLVPRFQGSHTVLLAASMLGATVMPHAIYLHSTLVRDRHGTIHEPAQAQRLIRGTRVDVASALLLAGSVNVAMLLLAASSLHGVEGTDSIEGAAAAISAHLGVVVGVVFAVGLLASGLASTSVGCYAGSAIMSGLLNIRPSILLLRLITLLPALVILWLGVDPTWALVVSQAVLSVGIPFALIPLVVLTARRDVMGEFRNGPLLRIVALAVTAAIVALNVLLLGLTLLG